ncbi:hypothetical protein [Curtobacterium sp. Leaf183]|uniref:hypothetical protein n=1 Tax=Curtobacterium sp. Leaf183 TaxID=1736291 RepID=UPI0012E8EA9B|nr:hypothetical protein [Curtobacterium sp. Leaf183]
MASDIQYVERTEPDQVLDNPGVIMSVVAATVRPATVVVPSRLLNAVLCGLEAAGARLPHTLAVPVMVAHDAVAAIAYR